MKIRIKNVPQQHSNDALNSRKWKHGLGGNLFEMGGPTQDNDPATKDWEHRREHEEVKPQYKRTEKDEEYWQEKNRRNAEAAEKLNRQKDVVMSGLEQQASSIPFTGEAYKSAVDEQRQKVLDKAKDYEKGAKSVITAAELGLSGASLLGAYANWRNWANAANLTKRGIANLLQKAQAPMQEAGTLIDAYQTMDAADNNDFDTYYNGASGLLGVAGTIGASDVFRGRHPYVDRALDALGIIQNTGDYLKFGYDTFFGSPDNKKALGGNLFSGEEDHSSQMNIFRRPSGEYFYQASPESDEVTVVPRIKVSDDPAYWTYADAEGKLYTPKQTATPTQGTATKVDEGPLVRAANNYFRELQYNIDNDIPIGGKYTMPAIAASALLPLAGEAFAGTSIAGIPATTWADAALTSGFGAHGLHHWANEGIDGWGDAAMTALEMTPLGKLAKPVYEGAVEPGMRFWNSPLTGNWTKFGSKEYRLSPNSLGSTGLPLESRSVDTSTETSPGLFKSYGIVLPRFIDKVKSFDGAYKGKRAINAALNIFKPSYAKTLAKSPELIEHIPLYHFGEFSPKQISDFQKVWSTEASLGPYSTEGILRFANTPDKISELPSLFADARQLQSDINLASRYGRFIGNRYNSMMKEITDPTLRHIAEESPQYTTEVLHQQKTAGAATEDFVKNLVQKANSYRRFMREPHTTEQFGKFEGSGIQTYEPQINVESRWRSDFNGEYGSYGAYYQGQPTLKGDMSTWWDQRVPKGVQAIKGVHTKVMPSVQEAITTRIPTESVKGSHHLPVRDAFFKSYYETGAPSGFINWPVHQIFIGERGTSLPNFKISLLEDGIPEGFKWSKGYGLGGNLFDSTTQPSQQMNIGLNATNGWQPYTLGDIVTNGERVARQRKALQDTFLTFPVESNDATVVSGGRPQNTHLEGKAVRGGAANAAWEKEHPGLAQLGYAASAIPFAVASAPILGAAAETGAGQAVTAGLGWLGDAAVSSPLFTNAASRALGTSTLLPWLDAGITAGFGAHGIQETAEGNFTPMTALEVTPLGRLAKPMAKEAALAVENYRYPLGRPQVPENFLTVKPQVRTRVGDVEIDTPNMAYRQGNDLGRTYQKYKDVDASVAQRQIEDNIEQLLSSRDGRPYISREEALDKAIANGTFDPAIGIEVDGHSAAYQDTPMYSDGFLWYGTPKIDETLPLGSLQSGLLVTPRNDAFIIGSNKATPYRGTGSGILKSKSGVTTVTDNGGRLIPADADNLGLELNNISAYNWEPGYGYRRVFAKETPAAEWARSGETNYSFLDGKPELGMYVNPDGKSYNFDAIRSDLKQGISDAVRFLGSDIKTASDAHNVELARRLGYPGFTPYNEAAQRAAVPVMPKYYAEGKGQAGYVHKNAENPALDELGIDVVYDADKGGFHETLHRGNYGELGARDFDPKTMDFMEQHRMKDDTRTLYKYKTDKLMVPRTKENAEWHDYMSQRGETGTNSLELGRRMGIVPGTAWPGKEKAMALFKRFAESSDPKAKAFNVLNWKQKPRRVWDALTGRYFTIGSGVTGVSLANSNQE